MYQENNTEDKKSKMSKMTIDEINSNKAMFDHITASTIANKKYFKNNYV